MIFQHSTELAIRAALYLAQQAPGKLTPVREIAEEIGVSETYLAKYVKQDTTIEQIDTMAREAEFGMTGEHQEILETYRMFAYDEGWSRRINEADRLVYEGFPDRVEFLQARYHYG